MKLYIAKAVIEFNPSQTVVKTESSSTEAFDFEDAPHLFSLFQTEAITYFKNSSAPNHEALLNALQLGLVAKLGASPYRFSSQNWDSKIVARIQVGQEPSNSYTLRLGALITNRNLVELRIALTEGTSFL